ncbi:Olfactory receptor 11L1 [Varanus komodoensis]|uniref:olfactory receptor 11L1-like n=1 Tax=Varanus komodoensis TaxID=61221 RepID=UPI001CF77538|nr:olfactory receptor 11L1-like [Varanus komodoensis]KAF7236013.1 Olfactory receptor 11L1 [Varanus komodoensis]
MLNGTSAPEFILLGFPELQEFRFLLFITFLVVYLFVLLGNALIILISKMDIGLRIPMYFFLSNFSFLEMCYTSVTVPRLLGDFLTGPHAVSLWTCLTQMYFFFFFGTTEFFLLATMAFDRYLAICHPLQYPVLMDNHACISLALGSWLSGFLTPFLPIAFISQLPFNSSNQLDHFFCDTGPLIKLSTGDTFMAEAVVFLVSAVIVLLSFILTLISYALIVSTICRIPSASGRHKAFSTCFSHLMVVTIFYGTVIFMYLCPRFGQASETDKVVSVFYAVLTPVLNPIIYTLRNKDVKRALRKVLSQVKST